MRWSSSRVCHNRSSFQAVSPRSLRPSMNTRTCLGSVMSTFSRGRSPGMSEVEDAGGVGEGGGPAQVARRRAEVGVGEGFEPQGLEAFPVLGAQRVALGAG